MTLSTRYVELLRYFPATLKIILSPTVSYDESMIGTKCRVPFLQYLPKKPTKKGNKSMAVC